MIGTRGWLRIGLGFCVVAASGGCMVEMAARTDRRWESQPRLSADVRIALYADEPRLEAIVRDALERDPLVHVDPLDEATRARYRQSCGPSLGCDTKIATDWARARGITMVVVARTTIARTGARVCDDFRFTGDGGRCVAEHIENETATARIDLRSYETEPRPRQRSLQPIKVDLHGEAAGPGAVEAARDRAFSHLPVDALANTASPQLTVDDAGRLQPGGATDGTIFAVLRGKDRQGLVGVHAAGTPAERVDSLYCCLRMQPGDKLIYRGPQMLWELLPSVAATRLTLGGDARPAGMFGLNLRVRNVRRGFRTGAAVEWVVAPEARLWLGTVELGYGWRPSPAWAIAALAAGGGGAATQSGPAGASLEANGGHLEAVVRATWEPRRWVFVNLDLGFIQSFGYRAWKNAGTPVPGAPLTLVGPLVRLAAGVR